MKSKSIAISIVTLLIVALPLCGHAQNGIVAFEIPYTETDYIDCLGESVEFNVTVTVRGHWIELANGGTHFVENWFIEGTATGLNSGLTWYGRASGPWGGNATGDQWSEGWVVAGLYEPLDGGQKFRKSQRLRFVNDANGVARVEHYEDYQFHCLGNG